VLKVLQLCNKAPYPANDGSSIAIYNMAKGLIDNDVQLHLLTINTKKHFKADDQVPAEFRKKSHYASVFKNTNTSASGALLNLFSPESYFVSRFYFKEFEQKLITTLKNNSFDIIQLEGLFMGVYLKAIRKYSTAKVVLRAHNIEHFIWNRHILNEKNRLKKTYLALQNKRLKKFELKVLATVDAIVPITEVDKKGFKRLGFKKPLYACITGVDVNEYQLRQNTPVKPNTIFYFGSMDWLPNQEAVMWFLDHCWPQIHKTVPEARFVIAGRGMPPELLHLSKPNVLVIENVSDGKAFFHQHQLMIVPLLSGSGLRIKIIEGMAYGKAIVSTSVGAEGINYTDKKDILIADTPATFIDAVTGLLKDGARRAELEKNATVLAHREFDNLKVVAGLVHFYKELLHV
jgi:glycosyltransferase involved in cell wall biosynthesis